MTAFVGYRVFFMFYLSIDCYIPAFVLTYMLVSCVLFIGPAFFF